MRIKVDENLPTALVGLLAAAGHDVDSVPQEGLTGQCDDEIWSAAQAAGRFLITQDLDFSDTRRFTPGTHHGLLLVRLADPSRRKLLARMQNIIATHEIERWRGCFVVSTDRKIRVKWPTVS